MIAGLPLSLFPIILISLPAGAWPMIGLSLAIGIAVAIIFQLVSVVTQHPEHKALANEELAALLFSIFIIWFWVGSDALFHNLVGAITQSMAAGQSIQGLPTTHIGLALLQLSVFQEELSSLYLRLSLIDFFIGFMSTLSFNIGMLPGGIGIFSIHIAPYAGLSLVANAMATLIHGVLLLALLAWGKRLLVLFASTAIPIIFLPFGLILRANPFTRTTGSTVIAVCFVLYFVYPLATSLSFYLVFDIYGLKFDNTYLEQFTPFKTLMGEQEISKMVGDIGTTDKNLGESLPGTYGEVSKQASDNECGIKPTDGLLTKAVKYLFCGIDKLIGGIRKVPVVGTFIGLVWDAMKAMLSYSGSFFKFLFGSGSILLPAGMTLAVYTILTDAIVNVSELLVVGLVTTVLEIMISITMYRNIALLIGGEAELMGLSKLV